MKASAPSSSAARLIQDLVSEAKWLLASGVSAVQASSAHCRARSRHSLGSPGMLASFATPYIPRRKSIPKRLMCPNWVRSSYGVVHAAAALCRGARAIVPESKSRVPVPGPIQTSGASASVGALSHNPAQLTRQHGPKIALVPPNTRSNRQNRSWSLGPVAPLSFGDRGLLFCNGFA